MIDNEYEEFRKLNLACGPNRLPGFLNLDLPDWRFEDGFPNDWTGQIKAATESHGLMYVAIKDWPLVFSEVARVLEPGGIVRITEDNTGDEASERYGGWHDAVTLTTPKLIATHLRKAKLVVLDVDAETSMFEDRSLMQAWHGAPPKVFFVEGRKLG